MAKNTGMVYQRLDTQQQQAEQQQTERRRKRLMQALAKHGFATVQESAASLDAGVPYENIKFVGPVLGEVMREMLAEGES